MAAAPSSVGLKDFWMLTPVISSVRVAMNRPRLPLQWTSFFRERGATSCSEASIAYLTYINAAGVSSTTAAEASWAQNLTTMSMAATS
eukprot:1198882-Heterocapsa_arctica.AAC.1